MGMGIGYKIGNGNGKEWECKKLFPFTLINYRMLALLIYPSISEVWPPKGHCRHSTSNPLVHNIASVILVTINTEILTLTI